MLGIFAQLWIWDVLHWTCEWRTDMPLCKIRVIHRLAWTCLSLKIRHPLIRCTIIGHLLIYISVHFSNALWSTGWWITLCWPNLLIVGTRRWWPRSHNVPHVGICCKYHLPYWILHKYHLLLLYILLYQINKNYKSSNNINKKKGIFILKNQCGKIAIHNVNHTIDIPYSYWPILWCCNDLVWIWRKAQPSYRTLSINKRDSNYYSNMEF